LNIGEKRRESYKISSKEARHGKESRNKSNGKGSECGEEGSEGNSEAGGKKEIT
jgi:hypothetical protein